MSDANLRKPDEAGKASLEQYDVDRAISIVRELGEGLIEATKHSKRPSKHHFRKEWLDQLIERYRRQPGKPVIHLDDLGDEVIPSLSGDGAAREFLRPYWEGLVKERGSEWCAQKFRCVWDIFSARGDVSRWSKLGNWRKFSELTGLHVNDLEPFVVALRAGVGHSRVILNPKLPFNLATPAGAKIIGYRGDAAHATSAFVNGDPVLHEDYKEAITETIGSNPFTTTFREDGVNRSNVGVLVTQLVSLAGLDVDKRQNVARNPFPAWFFIQNDEMVIAGMRACWDAEGSSGKQLQLGQSIAIEPLKTTAEIPIARKHLATGKLEPSVVESLKARPPLLLVSASLLLYRLGFVSYMHPQTVWRTKRGGYSALWTLCIYGKWSMQRFAQLIDFQRSDHRDNRQ